ncbi:unnamed protein product [Prunus armeniaca]|uniref:Uncharacterized protein n=1 Tax=Prunus armeniaca TaxID=36596 RepID=A0A6J5XAP5_PRUAR|nr:unnamed protein product [Prunus armeniaca]
MRANSQDMEGAWWKDQLLGTPGFAGGQLSRETWIRAARRPSEGAGSPPGVPTESLKRDSPLMPGEEDFERRPEDAARLPEKAANFLLPRFGGILNPGGNT